MRQLSVQVYKVLHIYLGRGVGLLQVDLFVFFPQMNNPATNFLSDHEEALWYDEIWMPAIIQVIPCDRLQEVLTSWNAAVANSVAKALESYFYKETIFYNRQRLLIIVIQP